MEAPISREGKVDVPGGQAWYRVAGDGPGVPLLVLHGGPGAGHDYLEPLQSLGDERPVVFYDQLGCGKSDIPGDDGLWVIERFVEEVGAVRRGLGLGRVHLLGQSWGGWLAIEYMLSQPDGIASLTLASTSASTSAFAREARVLVNEMGEAIRAVVERCEADGTTDSPEYQAAVFTFYAKHLCRLPMPWPDCLMRTAANVAASPVYRVMNGPSEWHVIGNLKDWDRTARLGEITAPALITVGRYDEIPTVLSEEIQRGIPGSRLVVFEESSHTAHIEEQERYEQVLREFLRENDGN